MKEKYSTVSMRILQEKGYFGHDDASLIVDGDPHFIINPISREIVNNSKKTDLIQFDHNSERITFECPHFIEGHDMTFCNKVVIDYSVGESKGVYEINDLAVKEDDSDTVVFTWLISSNVTTTLGKIKFALTFKCVLPDGSVTYKWGTKRNDTLQCFETEQGNAWVAYDYPDILEQWKTIIFDAKDNSVKDIVSSTNNGVAKIVSEGKIQTQAINTTGITVKNDIEKKAADTLATIPEDYAHLDSDVAVLKSENVRYSARFGNALIKKATGNKSVTILDSADAVFHDLQISGKSEQIITTGANLLDLNGFTKSGNATYYAVGSKITVIGSSSNDTITYFFPIENMGGKTYILSCKTISNSEPSADYSIAIGSVLGSTTYLTTMEKGNIQLKKTISESATRVGIFITPNNARGDAVALNTLTIECLMFIENDTSIPWEPYTGGAPSPSPEYPQDIISVGTVSTGKQLFDASTIKSTALNGVTFTNNGDGSITVKGTATAETSTNFVKVNLEPGQYRISGGKAEIKIIARVQDDETINYYSNNKFDVTRSSNVNIYMQIDSGKTVDATVWPMLNAGDIALSWEPYSGGKPAPSEEYPEVINVRAQGVQLFDASGLNDYDGATHMIEEDGKKITIIGNSNANNPRCDIRFIRSNDIGNFLGKKLYISGEITSGDATSTVSISSFNGVTFRESRIQTNIGKFHNIEYAVPDDAIEILLVLRPQKIMAVFTDIMVSPVSLNEGVWEPYRAPQTVAIQLTEPLRGIGEHRDRIMCRDVEWGIERWITKLTLDGNEDWVIYDNSSYISFYTRNPCLPVSMNKREGLCEQLRVMTIGGKNLNTIWLGANNKVVYAIDNQFYNDTLEDKGLANWKAHLAESPLEIITYLDAPAWEPLPSATQQALNALTTYAGTTHLTITAGGPPAGIAAEYVQDINVVIAELLRQIEELRNAHTN